jgi:hypothetical protein
MLDAVALHLAPGRAADGAGFVEVAEVAAR